MRSSGCSSGIAYADMRVTIQDMINTNIADRALRFLLVSRLSEIVNFDYGWTKFKKKIECLTDRLTD